MQGAALFFSLSLFLSLSLLALAAGTLPQTNGTLRFWFDEYAFGTGETLLLEEAIAASQGRAAVSGRTIARFLAVKGYQAATKWDVYWTARGGCLAAFQRKLEAQQLVNCLPGTDGITQKSRLFATLEAAYGSASAALIAPLTFRLPRQYFQLARHLSENALASWVLKEEVHQGKGVHFVPAESLLSMSLQRQSGKNRFSLAQQLISNQLLVHMRPFYVRVWAVVFGSDPVRAYLYDGGVVVFGQRTEGHRGSEAAGAGLLVNLWRQDRAAADPWSLGALWDNIAATAGGRAATEEVWRQMQVAVAATVAAAVPGMRRAGAKLSGYRPHSSGFAVFGADFVLDASLKPWLVEMNALPSLARKVIDGRGHDGAAAAATPLPTNPFDEQKEQFVGALLSVLLARHVALQPGQEGDTQEGPTAAPQPMSVTAVRAEADAAAAAGFAVLTPGVYQALGCLAAGGNTTCPVLEGLPVGAPGRGQCIAPATRGLGWVRGAQAWLGDHVVRFLPRLSWGRVAAQSTDGRPALLQLSELDQRMFSSVAASS